MCSTDCTKENTVRTIFSFHVRREGELVIFTVSGDGFLYNMVRIMVGTLIFINEGKIGETPNTRYTCVKGQNKRRKDRSATGIVS